MSDPYSIVPKDLKKNLAFRREVIQMGLSDPKAALEFWIMSRRSIHFYINTFGWLHEPRPKRARSAVIPFITYDFQDRCIGEITDAIRNGHDLCEFKSRDMGASWMNLYCIEHPWHFEHAMSFALVSRNEKYVDDPGNMKALFQKIDFIHKHMPGFIMPKTYRVNMHVENIDTGSTIDGESTTGKVSRGDRRTAILLDEFDAFETSDGYAALGSTQFATECRLFNSTFESTAGAFYAVYSNPDIKKLQMPWWEHPVYSVGLYYDANGNRRSPWYDEQCKKASDPRIIARELDMNPEGAQSQFFLQSEMEDIIRKTARPPLYEGELDFDINSADNPVFTKRAGGKLKLWIPLDDEGKPDIAGEQFAIGADVSTGTGATNSTLSVANRENGIKIAEWADSNTRPEHFAKVMVALGRWLNNALLVIETPGPGVQVIRVVLDELHYGHIYFRENVRAVDNKVTLSPGWHASPDAKWSAFSDYRRALREGSYTNPSELALKECLRYVYFSNTIWHVKAIETTDPSGARDNHGDRATADVLSWKGCRYSPASKADAEPETIPHNSIAGRRARSEQRRRDKELAWN